LTKFVLSNNDEVVQIEIIIKKKTYLQLNESLNNTGHNITYNLHELSANYQGKGNQNDEHV